MEKFLTKDEIEDALNLDVLNNEIPQLEYMETMNISENIFKYACNDTPAVVSLAMLYGYKVGWYKAQLLNKSAKNTKA